MKNFRLHAYIYSLLTPALFLMTSLAIASPPKSSTKQIDYELEIKQLVEDGKYKEALDTLLDQETIEERKLRQDVVFTLARGSEILIYVNNEDIFEEYLPKLKPFGDKVKALSSTTRYPNYAIACQRAIEVHDYANDAYFSIDVPSSERGDIEKQIQKADIANQESISDVWGTIIRVDDDQIIYELSHMMVKRLPAYTKLDSKYQKMFAYFKIIEQLNVQNPLRAQDILTSVIEVRRKTDYRPNNELSDTHFKEYQKGIDLLRSLAKESFWKPTFGTQSDRKVVDKEIQKELLDLIRKFEQAAKSNDLEALDAVIYTKSRHRDGIIDAIKTINIKSIHYADFGTFVHSLETKTITVDSRVTIIKNDNAENPVQGDKTITFRFHDGKWLIYGI